VLSLHVLVEPKHHPLQHPWVRRMRRLRPELKREIADLAFVYNRHIPDCFCPPPGAEFRSFGDELDGLLELGETELALEFLRPLYDHRGERDPALLARAEVRKHAVERAAAIGADGAAAAQIFAAPRELAERVATLLTAYWEAEFAAEWARLEPRLAETVSEAGRVIAAGGIFDFLERMPRRLRVDRQREEVGVDLPHDHRVEPTPDNRLLFVPSAFAWPHVFVNCDEPWPLSVIYPAPFVADEARAALPPAELVGVLRAVGDHTRLRALRLISERPRSTQELAPLVGITEAGLSKHLRQLARAGLVETRREGYYVLYRVVPERIAPLSDALLDFLGRAAPD
jgi:DNA-binding transcriptional ArsR family regulator